MASLVPHHKMSFHVPTDERTIANENFFQLVSSCNWQHLHSSRHATRQGQSDGALQLLEQRQTLASGPMINLHLCSANSLPLFHLSLN